MESMENEKINGKNANKTNGKNKEKDKQSNKCKFNKLFLNQFCAKLI